MKSLLPVLLLLLPLAGFSQKKEKDPFIGMDKQAIIRKFGKPSEIRQNGEKGTVLLYKKEMQSGNSGQVFVAGQVFTFNLDKQGKVVAYTFTPASQPDQPIIAY